MSLIKEGLRIFSRSIKISFSGFAKYSGNDEQICNNIVSKCYNKEKQFFQASLGNYPEFYSRDFGMCTASLIKLGYRDKIIKTLEYALSHYSRNQITVLITPEDKPINFPSIYSPDSVAYLFRSLRIAKAENLVIKYKNFLNSEIKRFEEIIENGIIKYEHYSGMRDHAIVKSSCYDMIMACMLCDEIEKINKLVNKKVLDNRLKKNDLKKTFPAKYVAERTSKGFVWQNIFVRNWETDKIWTFLGIPYIDVLLKINKKTAKMHIEQYKKLIEKNGFVEVYDKNGLPYKTLFFAADTDMLWACMYLEIKKKK